MNPFPPEVVAQIMRHMNDDHAGRLPADLPRFAARAGPHATAAVMSGMDADGIEFDVTCRRRRDADRGCPSAMRLTQRAEVRVEVTRLYHDACALRDCLPA